MAEVQKSVISSCAVGVNRTTATFNAVITLNYSADQVKEAFGQPNTNTNNHVVCYFSGCLVRQFHVFIKYIHTVASLYSMYGYSPHPSYMGWLPFCHCRNSTSAFNYPLHSTSNLFVAFAFI